MELEQALAVVFKAIKSTSKIQKGEELQIPWNGDWCIRDAQGRAKIAGGTPVSLAKALEIDLTPTVKNIGCWVKVTDDTTSEGIWTYNRVLRGIVDGWFICQAPNTTMECWRNAELQPE